MEPLRVLIADGDRDLCVLYHAGLGRYGFEVTSAATGLECIARLKDSAPDVVVLEPALPWGQGEGILARMRENADVPCVPVILLCASLPPHAHP
jgi:DNA-binding response OmpR family regulator